MSADIRTEFRTVRDRDTHLGNGKMLPGQVYNEASTVQDVWIKTDDGKEMKLPFEPLGLAMREGHAVSFICSKTDKGTHKCLGARNFSTGEIQASTESAKVMAGQAVSHPPKLPLSAWWVQMPALFFAAVVVAIIEAGNYWVMYFIFTLFWGGMGLLVIQIWRTHNRDTAAGQEAFEILRHRLDEMPRGMA